MVSNKIKNNKKQKFLDTYIPIKYTNPQIKLENDAIKEIEDILGVKLEIINRVKEKINCINIINGKVIELSINQWPIDYIPNSITNLKSLKKLILFSYNLSSLPEDFGALKNLKQLTISHSNIIKLPESFTKLVNLEKLTISNTPLTALPENFGDLINLKEFRLINTNVSLLPDSFEKLKNLKLARIASCQINVLPETFRSNWRSLPSQKRPALSTVATNSLQVNRLASRAGLSTWTPVR